MKHALLWRQDWELGFILTTFEVNSLGNIIYVFRSSQCLRGWIGAFMNHQLLAASLMQRKRSEKKARKLREKDCLGNFLTYRRTFELQNTLWSTNVWLVQSWICLHQKSWEVKGRKGKEDFLNHFVFVFCFFFFPKAPSPNKLLKKEVWTKLVERPFSATTYYAAITFLGDSPRRTCYRSSG